jgi:hypothetical protein
MLSLLSGIEENAYWSEFFDKLEKPEKLMLLRLSGKKHFFEVLIYAFLLNFRLNEPVENSASNFP